jgi:hypothetical protein
LPYHYHCIQWLKLAVFDLFYKALVFGINPYHFHIGDIRMLLTMAIDSYKFAENKCKKLLADRDNNCSSSSGSTAVTTTVLPVKKIVNFLDKLDGK